MCACVCVCVSVHVGMRSPTGCTFWGKRTWSRKKTILAQLALLFGAPIGMALLTLLTPPIVMVALPAYWVDLVSKHVRSCMFPEHVTCNFKYGLIPLPPPPPPPPEKRKEKKTPSGVQNPCHVIRHDNTVVLQL